jgi:hypothetical protein
LPERTLFLVAFHSAEDFSSGKPYRTIFLITHSMIWDFSVREKMTQDTSEKYYF